MASLRSSARLFRFKSFRRQSRHWVHPLHQQQLFFSLTSSETCQSYIDSNEVVVFSKTTCGFCRRVQNLFDGLSLEPAPLFIQLNERPDGGDLQMALYDMTGQRTVPNVWVKGKHIGGADDTFKALADGSLEDLLDS